MDTFSPLDSRPSPWTPILAASERARFALDAVLPEDAQFDFTRPFLPAAMTGAEALPLRGADERLVLGHVRAHGYLALFGLVEEFILPFVVEHAGTHPPADRERTRALLGFAAEEAKHIELFARFRRVFARGFGPACAVIGPPEAVAAAVLAHPPLGVALAILHIEWMTQQHWLACVRDDASLEPAFAELLRVHWMEESQHARIDTMLVREIASGLAAAEIERGLAGYVAIVELLDGALRQQVLLDLDAFERAAQRVLAPAERDDFVTVQHAAMRRSFLLDGLEHRAFRRSLSELHPDALARTAALAARLR